MFSRWLKHFIFKALATIPCILFFTMVARAQVTEEWAKRYQGIPVSSPDETYGIALDSMGNLYVAGKTLTSSNGYDILVIKYDSSGSMIWEKQYNGPGNDEDIPADIKIDSSGNIYIAGYTKSPTRDYDYLLLKYDDMGTLLWASTYNSPDNMDDKAIKMGIDSSGNVYITGSTGTPYKMGVITIKYDSSGTLLWETRFERPEFNWEIPAALAIDSSGNAYVGGFSNFTSSSDHNIFLLKCDTAGGSILWSKDNRVFLIDKDYDIVVDDANNVYVAFSARQDWHTTLDLVTIKYNSLGDSLWESTYDLEKEFFHDMVLDDLGNIYVTGSSISGDSGEDIITIKYNNDGARLWVTQYNGPGNGDDAGTHIWIDGTGNLYVAGYSTGTGSGLDITVISYDNSGKERWITSYNNPSNTEDRTRAMVMDSMNNIYIAGISYSKKTDYDFKTIKFNDSGTILWDVSYIGGGPGFRDDQAVAMKMDQLGNIYVTGISQSIENSGDIATVKYDNNGNTLWINRYTSIGYVDDTPIDMVVDKMGNAYVTGYTNNIGTKRDIITIKYNSTGDEVWVKNYNGAANGNDESTGIACDSNGNVYVAGFVQNSVYKTDYITIKYNAAGTMLWAVQYDGPPGGYDRALDIAISNNNLVCVTGFSDPANGYSDYLTIVYDSNGTKLWDARYNGLGDSWDEPSTILVDKFDNVYITGYSSGKTSLDYMTIKYDRWGNKVWESRFNGPTDFLDEAINMVLDYWGNLYVTGNSVGDGTYMDITTIKYDPAGNIKWVARYDGPGNSTDRVSDLQVDSHGNVYVTGYTLGDSSDYDYVTIKYDPSGIIEWTQLYHSFDDQPDIPVNLAVDFSVNIIVSGTSPWFSTGKDYFTIKYASSAVSPVPTASPVTILVILAIVSIMVLVHARVYMY